MSLLGEIQNEAVDSKCDLATLLRKCRVLASRLGSQPLEDWLIWESNGYPQDVDVPEYRIWSLEIKGHFFGTFNSEIKNAPVPLACLPERVREVYERYEYRRSIGSIEETIKRSDKSHLRISTSDLSLIIGTNVYPDYNCVQAWAELPLGHILDLRNAVQNRILDFALALWKEEPLAGEISEQPSKKIEPNKITQIFITTVGVGSANVVGSASNTSIEVNISSGDFTSLERFLRKQSVSDEDIKDLQKAFQEDNQTASSKGFGPKVSSWIGSMMKKAADGSWKVGVGAAGSLLAQAISKYCGF